MTTLITEPQKPPQEIIDDAKAIATKIDAERVQVEDAVDLQWFIRVTGSTDTTSEREFEAMADSMKSAIDTEYSAFRTFYGVGTDDKKYLVRIEY